MRDSLRKGVEVYSADRQIHLADQISVMGAVLF